MKRILKRKNKVKKRKVKVNSNNIKSKKQSKHTGYLYDHFVSLFRFNIRFKLALGYAIQLTFLFVLLSTIIYFGACQYVWNSAKKDFNNNIENLNILFNQNFAYDSQPIKMFADINNLHINIYNTNFERIYSYPQENDESFDLLNFNNKYVWWNGHQFPNLYEKITLKQSDASTFYFVVKKHLYRQVDLFNLFVPPVIVALIVILAMAIRSSSLMAQQHLEPIHTMTSQVRKISAHNLNTRLDIRGTKDELKDLAHTFNHMLDGIARSYEREKQFVSDASHELRTPIAVIKGYAALLQRWGKSEPEVLEESINAIVSETDSMQSLVESLLFIARKDRGTLQMSLENFSISDLVNDIVRDTHLIDNDHKFLVEIAPNLIQYGSADKLKQAFRILIDNSIKYTPNDGIIQIDLKSSEQHNIFIVSDTGIGISKKDLPNIFDRFYRADKSRTKYNENHGGTGLGLSIAKIIIEQHNGRIHVESELNIGTKFAVFLPKEFDEK